MYLIKHKPSGLYFCNSKKVTVKSTKDKSYKVKTNLSPTGRVYQTHPGPWLKRTNRIYSHLNLTDAQLEKFPDQRWGSVHWLYCSEDDWEIIPVVKEN